MSQNAVLVWSLNNHFHDLLFTLSKADSFNQAISIDLHYLEKNYWYLHMVDEFTRFSAGAIITSRTTVPKVLWSTG